jgi:hypothetical protein
MKRIAPRPNPPETITQAKAWMTVKNIYLELGLCEGCAAQAAWGHQCGFTVIHPPCNDCMQVIAAFPVEKPNGWRTRGGKVSRIPGEPAAAADEDAAA